MHLLRHLRHLRLLRLLSLLIFVALIPSATAAQTACSSQNTASSSAITNNFNSNGYCIDTCRAQGFVLAIVQGKQCWCSDYLPSSEADVSECSVPCPGYPSELCGNDGAGLFGYIEFGTPSGTADGSSSVTSDTESSETSGSSVGNSEETTEPITQTTTEAVTESTTEATTESTTEATTESTTEATTESTTEATTQSTTESTTEVTRVTSEVVVLTTMVTGSVETVYINGDTSNTASENQQVYTTFVTSVVSVISTASGTVVPVATESAAEAPLASDKAGSSFWSHKGKVAGVFVAVGIVVVALCALLLFWLCRRRRNAEAIGPLPEMEKHLRESPVYATGFDEKVLPAVDDDDITTVPLPAMAVDQRLDPQHIYMQWYQNESKRSLQDDHDYSRRVFTIANPDPDHRPSGDVPRDGS